ncbi:hypothetical protein QYF36_017789 [Acer negundo]|nr:hypothetical protein QYF36_017789 [Acer negundo]
MENRSITVVRVSGKSGRTRTSEDEKLIKQRVGILGLRDDLQESEEVEEDSEEETLRAVNQNPTTTQAKSGVAKYRIRQEGKSSTFSNPIDLQGMGEALFWFELSLCCHVTLA